MDLRKGRWSLWALGSPTWVLEREARSEVGRGRGGHCGPDAWAVGLKPGREATEGVTLGGKRALGRDA